MDVLLKVIPIFKTVRLFHFTAPKITTSYVLMKSRKHNIFAVGRGKSLTALQMIEATVIYSTTTKNIFLSEKIIA